MDNVKPWQIVLMVLAVIALGFSVWKFGISGGPLPQADSFMTVDIMTGQLYDLRKGKAKGITLPFKHPETGERTLYPVTELDGSWEIRAGYIDNIDENLIKNSKVVQKSGSVQIMDTEPIVHVVLK